jgi:hypothetical protein
MCRRQQQREIHRPAVAMRLGPMRQRNLTRSASEGVGVAPADDFRGDGIRSVVIPSPGRAAVRRCHPDPFAGASGFNGRATTRADASSSAAREGGYPIRSRAAAIHTTTTTGNRE